MKISVVTVAYNSEATIEDTIKSVLAQKTKAEVEHIIIDGGSTDATLDIIDRYRDRIAQVHSGPDEGIYDAMNKGLFAANGDFTGFLNSDDYFASADSLEILRQQITDQSLDAVWGDIVFIDASRRPCRRIRSKMLGPKMLNFGIALPHPAFYARTDLMRSLGGFEKSYRIVGDFDMMLRLSKLKDFKSAPSGSLATAMRMGGVSTAGLAATRKSTDEIFHALANRGNKPNRLFLLMRFGWKIIEIADGRLDRLRGSCYAVPSVDGLAKPNLDVGERFENR